MVSGARQVGKTTMLKQICINNDLCNYYFWRTSQLTKESIEVISENLYYLRKLYTTGGFYKAVDHLSRLPKTLSSKGVMRAEISVLIFFSSSCTFRNIPSRARFVR